MILTGKTLKPDKAKKLGLVDLVVDPFSLESVAISQVLERNDKQVSEVYPCVLFMTTLLRFMTTLSISHHHFNHDNLVFL